MTTNDRQRDAERIKKELNTLIEEIEFTCECDLPTGVHTLHEFIMIVLRRDREERKEARGDIYNSGFDDGILSEKNRALNQGNAVDAGLIRLGNMYRGVRLVKSDITEEWGVLVGCGEKIIGTWHDTPSKAVQEALIKEKE